MEAFFWLLAVLAGWAVVALTFLNLAAFLGHPWIVVALAAVVGAGISLVRSREPSLTLKSVDSWAIALLVLLGLSIGTYGVTVIAPRFRDSFPSVERPLSGAGSAGSQFSSPGTGGDAVRQPAPSQARPPTSVELEAPPTRLVQGHACFLYKCGPEDIVIEAEAVLYEAPDRASPEVARIPPVGAYKADQGAIVTHRPSVYEALEAVPEPANPAHGFPLAEGERFWVYGHWDGLCCTIWTRGVLHGLPEGETYQSLGGGGTGCRPMPAEARILERGHYESWSRLVLPGGTRGWLLRARWTGAPYWTPENTDVSEDSVRGVGAG